MLLITLFTLTALGQDSGFESAAGGPCLIYDEVPFEEMDFETEQGSGEYWDGNCYLYEPDFRLYLYMPPLERWFPEHHIALPLPARWKGHFQLRDWITIIWSPTRNCQRS